jgi:hypothetical protein
VANPRLASTRAARRTNKGLADLFGKMGSTQHPRGQILTAYRNAHRALRPLLREPTAIFEAPEILATLRRDVDATAQDLLDQAANLGQSQATIEAQAWELPDTPPVPPPTVAAHSAWLALLDHQIAAVQALVYSQAEPSIIVGDDLRGGILQPGPLIREGARWLTTTAMLAWMLGIEGAVGRDGRGFEWFKQTIPAIDDRTTDCCLKVAAQAVPIKGTFKLTGTPRYADKMDWSPFHDYCRTSVVLVPKSEVDDDLTARIRADARREIEAREVARARAFEIMARLVKLDTLPDSRRRHDDTEQITALREELLSLRQRAGYGFTVE